MSQSRVHIRPGHCKPGQRAGAQERVCFSQPPCSVGQNRGSSLLLITLEYCVRFQHRAEKTGSLSAVAWLKRVAEQDAQCPARQSGQEDGQS